MSATPNLRDGRFRSAVIFREDFAYDDGADRYTCPGGRDLLPNRRAFQTIRPAAKEDGCVRYRAAKADCDARLPKSRCCPNMPQRNVSRSIHEGARDLACEITSSDAYVASAYARKKVEMLFAPLKRTLGLTRLRLRGRTVGRVPDGRHRPELRKLAMIPPSPA